jgi:rsbT co-antagonist protein RsbR
MLAEVVDKYESALLADWIEAQLTSSGHRRELIGDNELRRECRDFLAGFRQALVNGNPADITGPEWTGVREFLTGLSRSRAKQGSTTTETATFVFSIKGPIFKYLSRELSGDTDCLAEEMWSANLVLDRLGLFTSEVLQKAREDVIRRQQQELLELSTPVVKLWTGILALPLIGTLDSARTQVVMESLLGEIVATGSSIAIIDITGVPMVDTLVAQHLLKTVAAARLMGADCIISGIRPQIAQTIIHLGVELTDVTTKASLADAFRLALQKEGLTVVPVHRPA